eukprot:TRINITY_DN36659_c0_g1_i2.p1 TRINITY_DN36659_c0_g1~~TRINITY_DN36659_c0_g1_i2.p1  ORF type:complete len:146 (-),score=17.83 TRINITY_DN36659_c0_g1_i2:210-647(-)
MLRGRIARLLELQEAINSDRPIVVRKDSNWKALGHEICCMVRGEGDGALSVVLRLLGDAPAERSLMAVQTAQQLLQQGCSGEYIQLGICPALGVSLSSSNFSRSEILLLVCAWKHVATDLPGLSPVRPRHHPRFYEDISIPSSDG